MTSDQAQEIAQSVLLWLAQDEERLIRFLQSSGASAEDVRVGLNDPAFLGNTLDVLLMDEASVLAFCADASLPNDAILRARAALPGGDLPNWT